jgi:branched-chain amino acid transport system ATP-binding protein
LKKVSLTVPKLSITGVLGPNGGGKTTLIKAVTGLNKIWSGRIIFDSAEIQNKNPYEISKLGVALAPEGRRIFTKLTVIENLFIGSYVVKDKGLLQDRLEWVFQLFPKLKERKHQEAGTLSGGEQQMLNIGRALMSNPKLLILDEPSLGLAPIITRQLFTTIENLRDEGITILLSEQNAALTFNISDNVYILEYGVIVAEGSPDTLKQNSLVRQAYLGV